MADRWSDLRFLPPPFTPQPRQIPHHNSYDYPHSIPPPLHANVSSSSHSLYPNPNLNPSYSTAAPPPETFKTSHYYADPNSYPAADNPFAPHGGYAAAGPAPISGPQQRTPAAATHATGGLVDYYYGRSGIGGGRDEAYLTRPNGNEFALKEAIRQYGADPSYLSSSSYVLRHQVPTGPFSPQPQIGPPHPTPQNGVRKPKTKSKPKPKPKKTLSSTTNTFHCNVCNIDCNSKMVFTTHEQGKRHKLNLENLKQQPTNDKTEAATVPVTANDKGKSKKNSIAPKPKTNEKAETSVPGTNQSNRKKKNSNDDDAPEEDLETKKRKVLKAGAEPSEVKVCEICNAVANSQKVFEAHLSGSRHLENVKKTQSAG